jgi:hypothetical protein
MGNFQANRHNESTGNMAMPMLSIENLSACVHIFVYTQASVPSSAMQTLTALQQR